VISGSLAQAKVEQFLFDLWLKESARGTLAIRALRTASPALARQWALRQTAGVIPVVGQAIMIGGTIYTVYEGWKVIRPIYANTSDTDQGNKSGDALAGPGVGANSASLPPGGPDGDENNREKTIDDKRAKHIFRDKEGHLPDTPANRKLLEDVASDPRARLSVDKYGNEWFARTDANGNQVWAQVRGDRIINGGVNNPPRTVNPQTGLSAPNAPGWK
jgi:filamentous hemagglutinin